MTIALTTEHYQSLIKQREHWQAVDLLRCDMDSFLSLAYLLMLGRPVDGPGYSRGTEFLLSGGGRFCFLQELQNSPEGGARQGRLKVTKHPGIICRLLEKVQLLRGYSIGQRWLDEALGQLRLQAAVSDARLQSQRVEQELLCQLAQVRQQYRVLYQMLQQSEVDELYPALAAVKSDAIPSYEQSRFDAFYMAFEDRFRGARQQIEASQRIYIDYISRLTELGPVSVLDIGCGRGEWLTLLAAQGWQACGVDMNRVMVESCQAQGLDVTEADVIHYLQTQPDNSLSAVTGFHIIEHLPFEVLFTLCEEVLRVLKPGGMVVFETPNPENILVGSHYFYQDVTHQNPLPPLMIEFLAQYIGYSDTELLRLHEPDESHHFAPDNDMAVALNHHFNCGQDYALIARKAFNTQAFNAEELNAEASSSEVHNR
ncbi:MAG: methyltransferase domain-containing protein [Marinobacterium sp.]|nr:methyltransferase domain-containing protein [Marinobacterium sp.]